MGECSGSIIILVAFIAPINCWHKKGKTKIHHFQLRWNISIGKKSLRFMVVEENKVLTIFYTMSIQRELMGRLRVIFQKSY